MISEERLEKIKVWLFFYSSKDVLMGYRTIINVDNVQQPLVNKILYDVATPKCFLFEDLSTLLLYLCYWHVKTLTAILFWLKLINETINSHSLSLSLFEFYVTITTKTNTLQINSPANIITLSFSTSVFNDYRFQ